VGAYVLDVLEPDERERMQHHLDSCRTCHAALLDLAALPTRLAAVTAADVLGARPPDVPSELAFRRLHAVATGEARRRRRRARGVTVAAALVVVGVAGGVVALRSADGPPQPDVVTAAAGAVHARAALTATQNGTRVVLTLEGVPADEQCRLVAVGLQGQRQTASTWTATYDGDASVTGWLSMRPGDIDRLVIETLDGTTLLTLPSPHE
jgi:hypothetical protein